MSTCSLAQHLMDVRDPRRETKNLLHPMQNILAIAFCSIICGSEKFTEMEEFGKAKREFFGQLLDLSAGIPSHDTFGRVFAAISPDELMNRLSSWLVTRCGPQGLTGETVAIDGKAMRGAGGAEGMVHVVGAWASEHSLALGQRAVDGKSNETEAIPHLIEMLDLEGAVVTIDAAGCQKNIAAKIIEQDADYVLALKKNHPTLYAEVADCFLAAFESSEASLRHVCRCDCSHGREETRDYYILPVPSDLYEIEQWEGLRSIGMAARYWIDRKTGEEKGDVRYYISSLEPKVKRFAKSVRSHWSIENSLHWVLDVAFREDACRIENPTTATNLSAMNRLALSAIKSDKIVKRGVATKRKVAGWKDGYLLSLLDQCG